MAGSQSAVVADTAQLAWRRPGTWLAGGRGAILLWAVVVVGAALRLAVWQQARSLYLDEANLLRNYAERSYADLFRPLDYAQYAPPFFSVLMKATTGLFGYGERAVRLVPLGASVAGLGVFAYLAGRRLRPPAAVLATAFVAFGSIFIEFSATAKQYSTDLLVVLLLVALADRQLRRPSLSTRTTLAWGVGGALALGLAMPAVFALAGVGGAFGWQFGWCRRQQSGRAVWGRLAALALAWSSAFGAYFLLVLQADAQGGQLQQYHGPYFLAFPPHSAAEWALLGEQFRGLIDRAFGKTTLALGLAVVGFSAGVAGGVRRDPARVALLLAPVGAALGASALHYYSLLARLMLFSMPLVVLLIFSGLQFGGRWLRGAALALTVVVLGNQQRLGALFGKPFLTDYADVRAGLRHVGAHQRPGEMLVAGHNVAPVVYHYLRLAPLRPALGRVWLEPYRWVGSDSTLLRQNIQLLTGRGHRRLWLITNEPDTWLHQWAAAHGTVGQELDFYRGYAFLFESK